MTGIELFNQAQDILLSCPTDAELAEDDTLEEAWSERLITWADDSGQKVEAYRAVTAAVTARATEFKRLSESYGKASKRELRTADRVEQMAVLLLKGAEELTGAPSVDCEDGTTVKLLRRRSPKVEVIDETEVPEDFIRITRKISVDKREALKALKLGDDIPGLELTHSLSERVSWGL